MYIYWNERAQLGIIDKDFGATLQLSATVTNELSCYPEPLWPSAPRRFADVPTNKSYVEANKLSLSDSAYLENPNLRAP